MALKYLAGAAQAAQALAIFAGFCSKLFLIIGGIRQDKSLHW